MAPAAGRSSPESIPSYNVIILVVTTIVKTDVKAGGLPPAPSITRLRLWEWSRHQGRNRYRESPRRVPTRGKPPTLPPLPACLACPGNAAEEVHDLLARSILVDSVALGQLYDHSVRA